MKDLRLTDDGDLYVNERGDIEITDAVIQAVKIRLRWFLGEWRINTDYGIPYYDEVFIKNPSTSVLEDRIRTEILTVDEVEAVNNVSISIDRNTRIADITFSITSGGEEKSGEVEISV